FFCYKLIIWKCVNVRRCKCENKNTGAWCNSFSHFHISIFPHFPIYLFPHPHINPFFPQLLHRSSYPANGKINFLLPRISSQSKSQGTVCQVILPSQCF